MHIHKFKKDFNPSPCEAKGERAMKWKYKNGDEVWVYNLSLRLPWRMGRIIGHFLIGEEKRYDFRPYVGSCFEVKENDIITTPR